MRTIPVDLILHSLAERLAEHHADCAPGIYADPVARCVDHRHLAEEWTCGAGVEQHARWFVRRLSGEDMGLSPDHPMVSGDTRAIEVAVARRFADHAIASLIEQDAVATARAATLLRAAQAVVGMPADATQRAEECSEERARMAVEMAADLAARPDIVAAGVTVAAKNGAITLTSPPPLATPHATDDLIHARLRHVEALLRPTDRTEYESMFKVRTDPAPAAAVERDAHAAILAAVSEALGVGPNEDIIKSAKEVRALSKETVDAAVEMTQAHRDLAAAKAEAAREVAARTQAEHGLTLAREMRSQAERDLAACKAERDEARVRLATIADALDTTASGTALVDCVKDAADRARRYDRVAKFMRAY